MDYNKRNNASASNNSDNGIVKGELTPWNVMKAIPGSIGSFDIISAKLGLPRIEVRRYIMNNKELREAIDDEMLSAQERIRFQTYKDGLDGQPQARQDFFKMVNGYFEKKDSAASQKESGPKTNIILHIDPPVQTYKMLSQNGEVVDIDVKELHRRSDSEPDSCGDVRDAEYNMEANEEDDEDDENEDDDAI